MTNFTQRNFPNPKVPIWNVPNSEVLLGLFDSDGSFQVKTYLGLTGLTFHVNITFSQSLLKADTLFGVLLFLGASSQTVSKRSMPSATTQQLNVGTSVCFAFSSHAGRAMLGYWAIQPPRAPGKYLDYLLACFFVQLSTVQADDLVNTTLGQKVATNKRVAELACLWLRDRMSGATRSDPNKTRLVFFYKKMNATREEIKESVQIGKKIFLKIKNQVDSQNSKFQSLLTEDYIVGYHIGDGSFFFSINTSNGMFNPNLHWTITDTKRHKVLLDAIKSYLISVGFSNKMSCKLDKTNNTMRLNLTGYKSLLRFKEWSRFKLPAYRQNQFDKMIEAVDICATPNYRNKAKNLLKLVVIKWSMNYSTNTKKQGSQWDDFRKVCKIHRHKYKIKI